MTYDEIMHFLNIPKEIDKEIEKKRQRVEELRESIDGVGSISDSERVQSSPDQDKIGVAMSKILDLEREIEDAETYKALVGREIDKMCSGLPEKERIVIHGLYVACKTVNRMSAELEIDRSVVKKRRANAVKTIINTHEKENNVNKCECLVHNV